MKTYHSLLIAAILFPFISIGQIQSVLPVSTAKNGSLTAVVYDWEAIGVNPSNLGWSDNHQFSYTILDAGISGQSKGMNFPSLLTALQSGSLTSSALSWQSILGSPRGMNTYADINWFALSFRIPSIPGAFAINLRDRIIGNAFLGPGASQALIHSTDGIYNDATIMSFLNGTSLNYLHYREINFDYGVKIFGTAEGAHEVTDISKCFSFSGKTLGGNDDQASTYVGVGFKYIFGVADLNGGVSGGGINAIYDMYNDYPNIPAGFFNTPGHGYAFDFGASEIYKRWTFGWSVTDFGSIKWKYAHATVNDTSVAPIKYGSDFMNELKNGTLASSTPAPDYTTYLPAKMRVGASYILNRRIMLSADAIFPLNKVVAGLQSPYYAIGGQWKATRIITISTGFATTANFGWGLPLGVTFNASHRIEFYMGTTDITAYLGKPSDANVSAAFWMFRYNF
ncbi:MAG TPA: DUF5723 family protein [Bacteroidia bacterium]|nr:DUF5723 family protein [Bacteroidia bacterium]